MAKIDITDDKLMREFSRLAMEKAFQVCADKALMAAEICPDDMSGRDALLTFSAAILSTNDKTWPAGGAA